MKNNILKYLASLWLVLLLLVGLMLNASAQTTNQVPNLIPPIGSNGLVTASVTPLGQIENAAAGGYNILKNDSFKNGFNATTLGLYQSGDWGFVEAVTTDSTNSINYGFFVGGIQKTRSSQFSLFDGGITISANGNYTLPVAGTVNLQAETGAVIDLSQPTAGAFNEDTGTAYKELYQTSDGNITIGLTAGVGYSTLFSDGKPFYVGGFTVTDRLKGSGFLGLW